MEEGRVGAGGACLFSRLVAHVVSVGSVAVSSMTSDWLDAVVTGGVVGASVWAASVLLLVVVVVKVELFELVRAVLGKRWTLADLAGRAARTRRTQLALVAIASLDITVLEVMGRTTTTPGDGLTWLAGYPTARFIFDGEGGAVLFWMIVVECNRAIAIDVAVGMC